MDLRKIEERYQRKEPLPPFRVGDIVSVHVRIREGEKERTQVFSGTVIRIRGGGRNIRSSFTVRRIVAGEGVERTFPYHSPVVLHVEVTRPGKVRRAKLYYLRERVGKATKVKERRVEPESRRPKARQKSRAAAETQSQAAAETVKA